MIESFASKETEKSFSGRLSNKLPVDIQRSARRKLIYLDEAEDLQDLAAVPGNRLEKLKGDRDGQHSIRINDQWQICFVGLASGQRLLKLSITTPERST